MSHDRTPPSDPNAPPSSQPSPPSPRPAQPLTPVQRRVLGILCSKYPEKVALTDLRELLTMQSSPREALLALADLGLAKAVMLTDDRFWRATSAGVAVIKVNGSGEIRK